MTDEAGPLDSSPVTDSRLRLVYLAGLALNIVALTAAATAGEWLVAITFVVVIVYLCVRYWMVIRS